MVADGFAAKLRFPFDSLSQAAPDSAWRRAGVGECWLLARLIIWGKNCQLLVRIQNSAAAVFILLPCIQKGHMASDSVGAGEAISLRRNLEAQLQHDEQAASYQGGRQARSSRPKLAFPGHGISEAQLSLISDVPRARLA